MQRLERWAEISLLYFAVACLIDRLICIEATSTRFEVKAARRTDIQFPAHCGFSLYRLHWVRASAEDYSREDQCCGQKSQTPGPGRVPPNFPWKAPCRDSPEKCKADQTPRTLGALLCPIWRRSGPPDPIRCLLTGRGLAPLVDWMSHYSRFWHDRFGRLEDLLKRMDQ